MLTIRSTRPLHKVDSSESRDPRACAKKPNDDNFDINQKRTEKERREIWEGERVKWTFIGSAGRTLKVKIPR